MWADSSSFIPPVVVVVGCTSRNGVQKSDRWRCWLFVLPVKGTTNAVALVQWSPVIVDWSTDKLRVSVGSPCVCFPSTSHAVWLLFFLFFLSLSFFLSFFLSFLCWVTSFWCPFNGIWHRVGQPPDWSSKLELCRWFRWVCRSFSVDFRGFIIRFDADLMIFYVGKYQTGHSWLIKVNWVDLIDLNGFGGPFLWIFMVLSSDLMLI